MTVYGSKDQIYEDYPIALKFVLERRVHPTSYDKVYDALSKECRAKIDKFSESVANFRTQYPVSVGFFVEIPATGDTGKDMNASRYVLLPHETGWEFFIRVAIAAGTVGTVGGTTYLAVKVGEKVLDKVLETSLQSLLSFMGQKWSEVIHGGVRVDHIEIRTRDKGVMKIPFSRFSIDQLECLLVAFNSISHIRECNQSCFFGNLAEPTGSDNPQAHD